MNKNDILKQFNLPSYIKGKSFSEASKLIENKFKDRQDKHSLETKNILLDRLAKAQEYLKNEQFVDSKLNKFEDGGQIDGDLDIETADYIKTANTALDFGKQLFSKPDVDIFGNDGKETSSVVESTLNNSIKGAEAGMAFGAPGAIVGGVVGGISGLIGTNKTNKKIEEAQNNKTLRTYNSSVNQYKLGGKEEGKPVLDYNYDDIILPASKKFKYDNNIKTAYSTLDGKYIVPNGAEDIMNSSKSKSKSKSWIKDNYSDILRHLPTAMNAYQLASMKKPNPVILDKLDNKYKKQYVDEKSLENKLSNSFNDEYITESSGGSLSRYASNARAAQLSKNKAISDAYLKADSINKNENKIEQQFDLKIDSFNIGQTNKEEQIDAQNIGVYNSEKSKLLGQIGTDIGNIGKEEKFKQMIKDSGLCYDSRGAYICGTDNRLTSDQLKNYKTNENKYGGNIRDNSMFTSYFEKILNKKK